MIPNPLSLSIYVIVGILIAGTFYYYTKLKGIPKTFEDKVDWAPFYLALSCTWPIVLPIFLTYLIFKALWFYPNKWIITHILNIQQKQEDNQRN